MGWRTSLSRVRVATSILILTVIPILTSSSILTAVNATSIPEAALPASLSAPIVVMDSRPTTELTTGEQLFVITKLTNRMEQELPAVVVIQVHDSEGVIESIGIVSGIAPVGTPISFGSCWIPLHAGGYVLKSFAISSFETPDILAKPGESNLTIVAALK